MGKLNEVKTNIKNYLKLYNALYHDKRTPRISKIFLFIALAYLATPFDIIPDFIPVLGQLDDLIIIPSCIYISMKSIPKPLYNEHYKRIFGKNGKELRKSSGAI